MFRRVTFCSENMGCMMLEDDRMEVDVVEGGGRMVIVGFVVVVVVIVVVGLVVVVVVVVVVVAVVVVVVVAVVVVVVVKVVVVVNVNIVVVLGVVVVVKINTCWVVWQPSQASSGVGGGAGEGVKNIVNGVDEEEGEAWIGDWGVCVSI